MQEYVVIYILFIVDVIQKIYPLEKEDSIMIALVVVLIIILVLLYFLFHLILYIHDSLYYYKRYSYQEGYHEVKYMYVIKPNVKRFFYTIFSLLIFIILSATFLYFTKHNQYTQEYYQNNRMQPDIAKQIIQNVKDKYSQACTQDLDLIKEQSEKYDIDLSFCYAIPAIESSMIGGKTSRSNALGLFQLKVDTANEVIQKEFNQKNVCISEEQLCTDTYTNILLGVGYLKRLRDHYLKYVIDEEKQLLLVAYAYNGGITRTLKAFHPNSRKAQHVINSLSSYEIKEKLDRYLSNKGLDETVKYPKKIYRDIDEFNTNNETHFENVTVEISGEFCILNYIDAMQDSFSILVFDMKNITNNIILFIKNTFNEEEEVATLEFL